MIFTQFPCTISFWDSPILWLSILLLHSNYACMHIPPPQDLVNDYECVCMEGWEGKDCGTERDECDPDPCVYGTCTVSA